MVDEARRAIIALIVKDKKYAQAIKPHLLAEEFVNPVYAKLYADIYEVYQAEDNIPPARLVSKFETVEEQKMVSKIFSLETSFTEEGDKAVNDRIRIIKAAYIERMIMLATEADDLELMRKYGVMLRNMANSYI